MRGADFISSMMRMAPSGDTSATICRMELEPMSIAAILTGRSAGVELERMDVDGAMVKSGS